jgi:hypothetical protein
MSGAPRGEHAPAASPRAFRAGGRSVENAENRAEYAAPLYRRALVVFGGRSEVWWLRGLRRGFRHCFVALDDGTTWLTVDPLLHRLEVRASGLPSAFDLAAEYRRMGLAVVEVAPDRVPLRRAPIGFFTCVETAKRLLGIRARRIVTPWQLYRFLAAPRARPAPRAAAQRWAAAGPLGRE